MADTLNSFPIQTKTVSDLTSATPTTSDLTIFEQGGVVKKSSISGLPFVNKAGDTMTGQLVLPGGGLGNQAISYAEAYSLVTGTAGLLQNYFVSTTVGGTPASGTYQYDNATQINSTNLLLSVIASDGLDLTNFIAQMTDGDTMFIQQEDNSANYQKWELTGNPVLGSGFYTIPVTLVSSTGSGTSNFSNTLPVFIYGRSSAGVSTTDELPEGSVNLYFTDSRALTSVKYIEVGNVAGSQADITGNYTVAATDSNRMLNISGGSNKTITVPADVLSAAAGSGKGFMCSWNNTGAGIVTFAISGVGAAITQMNGATGLTADVNRTGAIYVKSSTLAQVSGTI